MERFLSQRADTVGRMQIDCHTCVGYQTNLCEDCVVTFILHSGSSLDLETEEMEALDLLADEGLVPPLRLAVDPRLERRDEDPPPLGRDRRRA